MTVQKNIFREAWELINKKTGSQMTEAELLLVGQAITALNIKVKVEPELDQMSISDGLLKLAIEKGE